MLKQNDYFHIIKFIYIIFVQIMDVLLFDIILCYKLFGFNMLYYSYLNDIVSLIDIYCLILTCYKQNFQCLYDTIYFL